VIVIVDYGMGNLRSIVNTFEKLSIKAIVSSDIGQILSAEKIILPGVGAFDKGMDNLERLGFIEALNRKVIVEKTPVLGICLGMQLFTMSSEEGNAQGLGWIKGKTIKFKFDSAQELKIPHVGWNKIIKKQDSKLLEGIGEDNRFYFTHSYHVECEDKDNVIAETAYGYNFASVVQKDNIWGVQFHPETSHKDGMALLKNFSGACVNATS